MSARSALSCRLFGWALASACAACTGLLSAAEFSVAEHGAKGDGTTLNTTAIQKAIDAAAAAGPGNVVTFPTGSFLSGAVFLKSGVELRLDKGVRLLAVQDDAAYPERPTRVAGLEMVWPTALVNVYEQREVKITGEGVIDGNGAYWWHKFWGEDGTGGMLKDYTARGLRWAVDYDCKRVRALAIYKSSDIAVRQVTIERSGFWSLTMTYSERVTVDGVTIRANLGGHGPSSDGIDIDSSRDVLIEHCDIDCNDDNICLKAGRDADGLRVNRPTENVVIRDCIARAGHGMLTLGSETSGGIRNIHAYNLKGIGTSNGIRFKSAKVRGGVVEKIFIHDVELEAVENPLHFELNWYPAYSYPTIPESFRGQELPVHWTALTRRVEPPGRGIPEFRDIVISNVTATAAGQAIYANAYEEKPIREVRLQDIRIEAEKPGTITHAADWKLENVIISTPTGAGLQLKHTVGVPQPELRKSATPPKARAAPPVGALPLNPAQRLGLGNPDHGDAKPH
jgi:polygalacturonase